MSTRNKLNTAVFCLFLFSFFIQNCKNETDTKPSLDEEKENLIERIEEFNSAFKDCKIEKLEAMITNNYLHTNSNSKSIGKADWLTYLANRKTELSSGNLVVKNYKMSETEVKIYDNTAILTAKISFSSIKSGERKENEIRITNVWVKEQGIWKRAGFHDTRIK